MQIGSTLKLRGGGTVDPGDTVNGGTVNVGEAPAIPVSPGTLRVGPSETLTDTGVVDGRVLNDGGTVSPGLSPGALTINADCDQQGGELLLEVTSATVFDQLVVGGKALLNGDLVSLFLNDFLPSLRIPRDSTTGSSGIRPLVPA